MPSINIINLNSVRRSKLKRQVSDPQYPTKDIEVVAFRCANPNCPNNAKWRQDDLPKILYTFKMRVTGFEKVDDEYWIDPELHFCSVACAGETLSNLAKELNTVKERVQ